MKPPASNILFCFTLALAMLFTSMPGLCADAWNLHEGDYRISLLFSRIDSRQEFNGLARPAKYLSEFSSIHDGEYSTTDLILRSAYGVTPDITLIGETQFRQSTLSYVDSFLVQRPNSGIGDIYLAGRWGIIEVPFALSVQVGWKIPLADTGNAASVALGDGEMDFDGVVAAGIERSIGGFSLAAQSQFGMLFRGGNYGTAMLYREEFGVTLPGGHVGVHTALHGFITQGPIVIPTGEDFSAGFGLTNNRTLMEWTIGAHFKVSRKLMFVIDLSRGTAGRSTLTGNTFSLGISLSPGESNPLSPKK